jgi:hypothetical protein
MMLLMMMVMMMMLGSRVQPSESQLDKHEIASPILCASQSSDLHCRSSKQTKPPRSTKPKIEDKQENPSIHPNPSHIPGLPHLMITPLLPESLLSRFTQ